MYNKTQRNDTRADGPQLTHDYSNDDAGRLINTIVTDNSARPPTIVRDTDYALDGLGNRTTVTGDNCPGSYIMDPCLPEPADFQMNQYTKTPCDISRTYDKTGNLTNINYSIGNSVAMSYDYRNRLVSHFDEAAEATTTYAYDALGRRIEKAVDSGPGVDTTHFFYDHWCLIEEQDNTATTLATYINLLNMQADANDFYYHTDDIGNVMTVSDDEGIVVERYEYQDYGEPEFFDSSGTPIFDSAIDNPLLFNGLRYDIETGWYNYGNRYFDPIAGRSISADKNPF
jgi:RHS repeat-associated protein